MVAARLGGAGAFVFVTNSIVSSASAPNADWGEVCFIEFDAMSIESISATCLALGVGCFMIYAFTTLVLVSKSNLKRFTNFD